MQTHTGPIHAASLLWVHKSFDHVDLEDLVFIVSSIPSGSYIFFPAYSSAGFSDP